MMMFSIHDLYLGLETTEMAEKYLTCIGEIVGAFPTVSPQLSELYAQSVQFKCLLLAGATI